MSRARKRDDGENVFMEKKGESGEGTRHSPEPSIVQRSVFPVFKCSLKCFLVCFSLNVRTPALLCFSMLFLPEALVDLMSVVVRMCPSVCESSHFAVLLGAYGASLSVLGEHVRTGWYDPGSV